MFFSTHREGGDKTNTCRKMRREKLKMGACSYGCSFYSFRLQADDVKVCSHEGTKSLDHKGCWEKWEQKSAVKTLL